MKDILRLIRLAAKPVNLNGLSRLRSTELARLGLDGPGRLTDAAPDGISHLVRILFIF